MRGGIGLCRDGLFFGSSHFAGKRGDLQTQARGLLSISAPVSFAIRHMAPLLNDYQRAHPAAGIDLQLNDRNVDIVEEGFDIALRIGHLKSSSLIAKRIAPVRLVMHASPEYLQRHGMPASPQDLRGHRFLRYSYMEESREPLFQWLQLAGGSEMSEINSNNGDVLMEAAIAGAGIALQPTFISSSAIQQGRLRVVLQEHEPEPLGLYAVYAHRQLLASKVRHFVDFLDGYFGSPPHWDSF
ncbi:substrate binding domain-containing protein [Halomonas sp. MA07-2]|uniref:substrate binding domain-containing protein n=1 Tax=Halomonas sp. MA07-2 TaxID=3440841 RepID=UPI003EEE5EB0